MIGTNEYSSREILDIIENKDNALDEMLLNGSYSGITIEDVQYFVNNYVLPNQELSKILEMVSFADKIIFGRTNYSKEVSAYKKHRAFYNECAMQVIEFCNDRKIAYHIKDGTISGEQG